VEKLDKKWYSILITAQYIKGYNTCKCAALKSKLNHLMERWFR